jgi:hypothetical protein
MKPKKVISGTKGVRMQVKKGQADVRQTRCTKCRMGLATQVPDGKGGFVYQCPGCGYTFKHTTM